jgi:hypothetical protein
VSSFPLTIFKKKKKSSSHPYLFSLPLHSFLTSSLSVTSPPERLVEAAGGSPTPYGGWWRRRATASRRARSIKVTMDARWTPPFYRREWGGGLRRSSPVGLLAADPSIGRRKKKRKKKMKNVMTIA